MTIGRSERRRFRRGAISAFATALLFAPGALAAPAAVDQYTEAPPTGPGGSSTQLETGGPPNQQGSQQEPSPAPAPAAEPAAPAPEESAPAPSPGTTPPAVEATDRPADKRPEPRRQEGERDKREAPARGTGATASPVGEREELPVTGYPVTPFVAVLVALGLAAIAVRGGAIVYGRLRGPVRDPS